MPGPQPTPVRSKVKPLPPALFLALRVWLSGGGLELGLVPLSPTMCGP